MLKWEDCEGGIDKPPRMLCRLCPASPCWFGDLSRPKRELRSFFEGAKEFIVVKDGFAPRPE